MKKRLIAAVALMLVAAAVLVPLAASHGDSGGQINLGVRLDFTSETEATGTFAACCAFTDSGQASAVVTSFVPQGNHARFEARNVFVGSDGTFTLRLRGVTGPLGSAVHVARARWDVIAGTGVYSGMRGQGRLKAVTDQNTGALTAIDTGRVSLDD